MTVLEIVNDALFEAKQSSVTQEEFDNDSNKSAIGSSARYGRIKRQVLASYPWKIAQRVIKIQAETITESAADTLYGITLAGAASYLGDTFRLYLKETGVYYVAPVNKHIRQYVIPEDSIRVRMVADVHDDIILSNVAGGYIFADESEVYLTYIHDIDEEDIDETLGNVISLALATSLSSWFGEADMTDALEGRFRRAWRLAKNLDAQQDSSRVLESVEWLERRTLNANNPYPNLLQ